MVQTNHIFHNRSAKSEKLDFHWIAPDTIAQALTDLNRIVDSNALLLRRDAPLAQGILRYEDLLIDAQGGDSKALKLATLPEEFDKIIDLTNKTGFSNDNHTNAANHEVTSSDMDYDGFRMALLKFREYYLSTSVD